MQIPLRNDGITSFLVDFFVGPSQINSPALAHVRGLDNKSLCLFLVKLVLKVSVLSWQNPGLGKEIEFLRKHTLHSG